MSAALKAHLAGVVKALAWSIRITRADGVVFRYTGGARAATIGGDVYLAAPGFTLSSITCTLGFGVDSGNIEFLTTDDMTRAQFISGRWRGAVVEVNQYNQDDTTQGFRPWPKYRLGNATPTESGFTVELRDLRQLTLQDMTRSTGPLCPYRFGSALCTKSKAAFTFAFTIAAVTSAREFTCAALAQATDYFTAGELYFADGPYASLGRPLWVLEHTAGGHITLAVPLYAGIPVIGQTGTIVAGCTKRAFEDCRDKFNNIVNHGGQEGVTAAQVVGADS
jgi:uncharacterized phage protein (TIGR02218 family)